MNLEPPTTSERYLSVADFDDQFNALTYGKAISMTLVVKPNGVECHRSGQKPVAMNPAKMEFDGSYTYYINVDLNGSETIDIDAAAVVALGEVMMMKRSTGIRFMSATAGGMDTFFNVFGSYVFE